MEMLRMLRMLKRLGFCFFLVLAAYQQARADELGSIKVTTNLFDSKVFLDDNFRGTAPLVLEEVPFGFHLLRLESEGCETFSRKYEVASSEPLLVKAVLRPQLNGILILNPFEGNENPKKIPITAFLAGGTFLEGYWGLLGIGAKFWSSGLFDFTLRSGGMTGVTSSVPFNGVYLEPNLLVGHPLREGWRGYAGIGGRASLVNFRGLSELRNYYAGNLVMGVWASERWFWEVRCGLLRNVNDPTRKLELGFGSIF
ncbi:MAG TPA: hypothetical protein DD435_17385 [Cyanobacteria bacterium UBA8530]|nr:hypothetical protein [Cyanobacteria bacterium UBA8530]